MKLVAVEVMTWWRLESLVKLEELSGWNLNCEVESMELTDWAWGWGARDKVCLQGWRSLSAGGQGGDAWDCPTEPVDRSLERWVSSEPITKRGEERKGQGLGPEATEVVRWEWTRPGTEERPGVRQQGLQRVVGRAPGQVCKQVPPHWSPLQPPPLRLHSTYLWGQGSGCLAQVA